MLWSFFLLFLVVIADVCHADVLAFCVALRSSRWRERDQYTFDDRLVTLPRCPREINTLLSPQQQQWFFTWTMNFERCLSTRRTRSWDQPTQLKLNRTHKVPRDEESVLNFSSDFIASSTRTWGVLMLFLRFFVVFSSLIIILAREREATFVEYEISTCSLLCADREPPPVSCSFCLFNFCFVLRQF